MGRVNVIQQQPRWAVEPPPAGSGEGLVEGDDAGKSNDQLSEQRLARKELFDFGGVWWHGTKGKWMSLWRCKNLKCGDLKCVEVSSTTNLSTHLKAEKCMGPQGYKETLDRLRKGKSQSSLSSFIVKFSKKDKAIHDWVEIIVLKNMPMSIVQSKFWQKKLKCGDAGPISIRKHD